MAAISHSSFTSGPNNERSNSAIFHVANRSVLKKWIKLVRESLTKNPIFSKMQKREKNFKFQVMYINCKKRHRSLEREENVRFQCWNY